jgi:23S rRNA (cytidine2498-2'-O)-methyltransferase
VKGEHLTAGATPPTGRFLSAGPPFPALFSASEDYFESAEEELWGEFGAGLRIDRLGPDLGAASTEGGDLTVAGIAEACRRRPLVFIRHLTSQRASIPVEAARDLDTVAGVALDVLSREGIGTELALQVWVTGSSRVGYGSGALRQHVSEHLGRHGYDVAHAGRRQVLSVAITPGGVLLGVAVADERLSDWPGGRVRLARDDDRVSRSEFKLEELLGAGLRLPRRGRAVDLGASPGGWTRILRRHGLRVWAVDPADLDARVAADPGVHHVRTTSGRFLEESPGDFDVVVNDMRMDPVRSCEAMLAAADHLPVGAPAVMTLKLTGDRPLKNVRKCLGLLRSAYAIEFARQLQHNRHEVTVVGRVPPPRN